MAYMIEFRRCCENDYCTRPATHAVFAYRNEPFGKFCKKHATERVARLTAAEANNPGGFR